MQLSDDEMTVLLIAAENKPMIPIGRWKRPVENLVRQGYLRPAVSAQDPTGQFNNVITERGLVAVERRDQEDTQALKKAFSRSTSTQGSSQKAVEEAAQLLARAARQSAEVSGDSVTEALRLWSQVALKRALELIHAME